MLVVPPRLELENSHFTGTEQVVDVHLDVVGMYSMPCSEVTGSFRRELLATGGQASVEFVLHRGPADFYCLDERVAFHVVSSAGLSPSPVRCSSLLRVFVPRDDSLFAMCQVYNDRGVGCQVLICSCKLAPSFHSS
jgi:hypothetical protein